MRIPRHSKRVKLAVVLVAVVVVVVAALLAGGHDGQSGDQAGQAAVPDTLRVAIEYSPLACYIYDDTLGGFGYDAVRLMAAAAGRQTVFSPIARLEDALEGLGDGTYDLLIAQFPVTRESRDEYLFSSPLYLDRQVLVQRADSAGDVAVRSQLDLAGKTLWAVKGSPMADRIESLSREIGDTIYIAEDDVYGPEQLFMRVAAGEIDYAVINESAARALARDYPGVDIGTGISFTQFQSIIMGIERRELRDSVDSWLAAVKPTRAFRRLRERYGVTE